MPKVTKNWIKNKYNPIDIWQTKMTNSSFNLLLAKNKKKIFNSGISKKLKEESTLSDDEWTNITDFSTSITESQVLINHSRESIEFPRNIYDSSNYEYSFNEIEYDNSDIKFSTMKNASVCNDNVFNSLSISPGDNYSFVDCSGANLTDGSSHGKANLNENKHVIKYWKSLNCSEIAIKQVKSEGILHVANKYDVQFIPLTSAKQQLTSTPSKVNPGLKELDISEIKSDVDDQNSKINLSVPAIEVTDEDKENLQIDDNEDAQLEELNKVPEEDSLSIMSVNAEHPYPVCSILSTLMKRYKISNKAKSDSRNTTKSLQQYPVCCLVSLFQKS
ncbi:uncharacterized protein LOC111617660 [Centruroides sculpturatus]|uniref:uncharacterized protein LOC111617660 n=1 Tax=Centruroides sculpturatus TaxID=218467 RepID=UPI000C6CBB66|nr:uncharacterized protein LOC111617660 [Centruroides sculpturatus]XP_023214705.1 uncharacterized protein LOC111617660 [Centruroides sculpturatus]XP_023214706.1 uncharacterized protein LOC111617660 [Centruroides sculpturatus]XP_023214707.1 uncharacterized protein LOC111617660 [Centruroides sculpturatus]